ncbi:restriction endonuclease subunit S [uncultured Pontibacter sp.]|uniref:restriction endonuclease subunit S n=1 Tax=uncultured Pontibacter sp. TaxID=453356 RepID=UPI002619E46F|nr:restriction endonuclease subunit S [uncultured Pontibacter sp.]
MEAVEEITAAVKNAPILRFPEFEGEWEHKPLNEYLSESKKRNLKLKFGKEDVLSVSGEFGIINQIEHLGRSYAGVSVHNYHIVETGDIVYTKSPLKSNPYGIIKINKGKAGIVSTLYAVYKVKEEKAQGLFFDFYFGLDANVNRYLRPLVKKGAKNDMKVNNAYVLNDKVFVPSIPEQKKIASFLSAIDNKIQQLRKKKALLEKYKKGVMQQIFSQQIRFKDDVGNDFPEWEEKRLSNVAKLMYGKDQKQVLDSNGQYPILGTGGLMGRTNSYLYDKPSVLIGRKGTIDKPVYIDTPFWTVDTLFYTEVLSNTLPKWLFYKFQTINWKLYNEASGVPSLSTSTIYKIKISQPSIDEQVKIANFLTSIDNKINFTSKQLEQAQQFKKGLLQQMFV